MKYRRITKIKSLFTGLVNRDRKDDSMDTPNLKFTMSEELLEFIRDVKLYNRPGIHTFSDTIKVSKGTFINFFAKVKFLVERLSNSSAYYANLYDTQYRIMKIPDMSVRGGRMFGRVYIEHGIGTELSFHNDECFIRLIMNPTLMLESRKPGFSASTYNYMRIAHSDDTDYDELSEVIENFFRKWEIPEFMHKYVTFNRADICMDIDMADFDIAKYIYYLRLVPKNNLSFRDMKFDDPDEYARHLLLYNSSQRAFSVYDKIYEEFENYNAVIDGNIMRIKFHLKSPHSTNLMKELNGMMATHCTSIIDMVSMLNLLAPIILPGAFDSLFPSGDFIKRQFAIRYLKLTEDCSPEAVRKIILDNDRTKRLVTYKGVVDKCKEIKSSNCVAYRRTQALKEKFNVAPYWLRPSEEGKYVILPSLPHLIGYTISKDEKAQNEIKNLWNICKYF